MMCRGLHDWKRLGKGGAFTRLLATGLFLLLVLQFSPCGAGEAPEQGVDETVPPVQSAEPADAPSSQPSGFTGTSSADAPATDLSPGRASGANISSIEFSPASPVAKEPIGVEVKFDRAFGMPVMLSYLWKINGEVVQESSNPTISMPTKRGDVVEVTVFTEEIRDLARSMSASVKVGGSPPAITRTEASMDDKGRYVARYEAHHPDGEPVTVSLGRGPDGMVLDTANSELSWQVPPGTQGNFPVELVATDPSGAKATCSFAITIRQEQPKEREKNAPSKP